MDFPGMGDLYEESDEDELELMELERERQRRQNRAQQPYSDFSAHLCRSDERKRGR